MVFTCNKIFSSFSNSRRTRTGQGLYNIRLFLQFSNLFIQSPENQYHQGFQTMFCESLASEGFQEIYNKNQFSNYYLIVFHN